MLLIGSVVLVTILHVKDGGCHFCSLHTAALNAEEHAVTLLKPANVDAKWNQAIRF